MNKPNDTVGIFYELPYGAIVRTCGFENRGAVIMYYFDDGKGTRRATNEDFQTWKPRRDLKDFPNAKDPILPYAFDLQFDIKHHSELVRTFSDFSRHDSSERGYFEDLIDEHKLRHLVGKRRNTMGSLLKEAIETMESMGHHHNCGVLTDKAEELTKRMKELE